MGWRVLFPDSVRVGERWVCDATVYNGTEKFPLTVSYVKDIEEVWPQVNAAIATRDAVTKKPPAMIPPGTDLDVPDLSVPVVVVEPPAKEEQERAAVLADVAAFNRAERLARYPQDLQDRIVAAGVEGIV